jgi:hypothetical protein
MVEGNGTCQQNQPLTYSPLCLAEQRHPRGYAGEFHRGVFCKEVTYSLPCPFHSKGPHMILNTASKLTSKPPTIPPTRRELGSERLFSKSWSADELCLSSVCSDTDNSALSSCGELSGLRSMGPWVWEKIAGHGIDFGATCALGHTGMCECMCWCDGKSPKVNHDPSCSWMGLAPVAPPETTGSRHGVAGRELG